MRLEQLIEQNKAEMVELRRWFHQHPELSCEEYQTTETIRNKLTEYGVEIEECGLKTGVCAIIRGAKPGKTVAIREDIDALPMTETTGLPFASENPKACHSCGHDIHTAVLLFCAKVLNEMKDEFAGNIRLLFQPAEENMDGAYNMIQSGCMTRDPKPDVIVGVHTSPDTPAGSIGCLKGSANASNDFFTITVKGKGGHGAHPYRCIDPVAAAAYLICQLQTIVSRENPALKPAVLTIGSIHGGFAANVIPESVELKGTMRTFYKESRENIKEAIRRVSKSCCEAMRAEAVVEFTGRGVPPLVNTPEVIEQIMESAAKVIGPEHVILGDQPSPGSEDFSWYLDYCPGAQFRIGTRNDDPRTAMGLHNPATMFDEQGIEVGAKVLCQFALDYLAKSE